MVHRWKLVILIPDNLYEILPLVMHCKIIIHIKLSILFTIVKNVYYKLAEKSKGTNLQNIYSDSPIPCNIKNCLVSKHVHLRHPPVARDCLTEVEIDQIIYYILGNYSDLSQVNPWYTFQGMKAFGVRLKYSVVIFVQPI